MATLPASEFRHGISLACGCTASATLAINDAPAVVGCGVHGCTEIVAAPNLAGRTALCAYGGREVPSAVGLAFFEHRPDAAHDQYYCGCFGWD